MDIEDTLSVQDVAKYLGVAEKTVYRWLDNGKLHSEQIRGLHFIKREEVEALALSRQVQPPLDSLLEQHVKMLQALVDSHDLRIAQLEQEIATLKNDMQRVRQDSEILAAERRERGVPRSDIREDVEQSHTPLRPSHRVIWNRKNVVPEGVPPDAIALYEFASDLNIHRRTLIDYVIEHHLPHIAVPNLKRPRETLRYVTPEQQEAIRKHRGV